MIEMMNTVALLRLLNALPPCRSLSHSALGLRLARSFTRLNRLTLVSEARMRSSLTRLLAVAGAVASAACASSRQYGSSSAAGTIDVASSAGARLDAREAQLLSSMSDADILGHLITVDSMEIVAADSALRLSRSDDVLDLAKRMRAEHTANLKQDKDLAAQQNITPIRMFGGIRAAHVAASLDSVGIASDLTIDRHYVLSQIELNQHVLAELELLQNN